MDISLMTIRIVFLFIPGILATIINDRLVDIEKKSNRDFIVSTILFGIFSYIILFFFTRDISLFKFIENDEGFSFDLWQLLFACLIGVVLSVIISFIQNKGWIVAIANWANITNIIPEKSIFKAVVNDGDVLNSFVLLRDISNNLMYQGVILKFAELRGRYELFLGEVSVHNNLTGEKYYEVERIYLNIAFENVTLEIMELNKKAEVKEDEHN